MAGSTLVTFGHVDEEGFTYIVDRKKEMIKYKGFGIKQKEDIVAHLLGTLQCLPFVRKEVYNPTKNSPLAIASPARVQTTTR